MEIRARSVYLRASSELESPNWKDSAMQMVDLILLACALTNPSACREHHLLKTFWPGWSTRQYPDGRIVWTDPDGHTHTTEPGSRLLFPELCAPTAKVTTRGTPPPKHTEGLTMPRRKTTRRQAHRQRINNERRNNTPTVAQHLRESVPPF